MRDWTVSGLGPAKIPNEDILTRPPIVAVGVARQSCHYGRIDQMDNLVRPIEVRTCGGVTGKIQSSVQVLDLADVVRVRLNGSAGQDLLNGGRIQGVALDPRAA